jgi:hypothetical protein
MNYQVTLTLHELAQVRAGIQCYIKNIWRIRRASSGIVAANAWNEIIRDQIAALRALRKATLVITNP